MLFYKNNQDTTETLLSTQQLPRHRYTMPAHLSSPNSSTAIAHSACNIPFHEHFRIYYTLYPPHRRPSKWHSSSSDSPRRPCPNRRRRIRGLPIATRARGRSRDPRPWSMYIRGGEMETIIMTHRFHEIDEPISVWERELKWLVKQFSLAG